MITSTGLISPAMMQNPFSPFRSALTTSFTPLLTNFACDAFLTNLWSFLVVDSDAKGLAIVLTYLIWIKKKRILRSKLKKECLWAHFKGSTYLTIPSPHIRWIWHRLLPSCYDRNCANSKCRDFTTVFLYVGR